MNPRRHYNFVQGLEKDPCDIDELEWQRSPAKNVEVCWLKMSDAAAKLKFWHSENLTVAPDNVEVCGDTSNDNDPNRKTKAK